MTKRQLLNLLLNSTYCRIQRSKLHGIGVFSIKNIPAGKNPFPGVVKSKWIGLDVSDIEKLSETIKSMLYDFFSVQDGLLWVPEKGLNSIDISFFMNNSKSPNVGNKGDGGEFYTLRKIKVGEELTISYSSFDERMI